MNQRDNLENEKQTESLADLPIPGEQADEIKGGEIREARKNGSIVLYDQTH